MECSGIELLTHSTFFGSEAGNPGVDMRAIQYAGFLNEFQDGADFSFRLDAVSDCGILFDPVVGAVSTDQSRQRFRTTSIRSGGEVGLRMVWVT